MAGLGVSSKPSQNRYRSRRSAIAWGGVLVIVMFLVYAVTLQPVINGSSAKYGEDVGEFQNVLTQWGTAHPTGYPLYALTGAALTSLVRLFGVPPAAAASSYSLLVMILALAGVYVLLLWSEVKPPLAALTAAILGLVFPFWYHASVAEVYSLLMALIVLAFLIAVRWRADHKPRHLYELAFVAGLAIGHHRLALLMGLPLLVLIAPVLWSALRERPLRIVGAILCLVSSFLIYLYLPLRGAMAGTWIYGQPATWKGFWAIVSAREYGALVKPAGALAQLDTGLGQAVAASVDAVTWPVFFAGVLGLLMSVRIPACRWLSLALLVFLLLNVAFAAVFSNAVFLEAALMPAMLAVVVGLGLLAQWISERRRGASVIVAAFLLGMAVILIYQNGPTVYAMTHDQGGQHIIDAVRAAEIDRVAGQPVVMALWGRDFFALDFARHVTGELAGIEMVDHRANVKSIVQSGRPLYVLRPAFYQLPLEWWTSRLGHAYLSSQGGDLVRVSALPVLSDADVPVTRTVSMAPGIVLRDWQIQPLADDRWQVTLFWQATAHPDHDYSVSVKATDRAVIDSPDAIIAQADSNAPVLGLYPTTLWSPGEIVRDDYVITSPPDRPAQRVEITMYMQDATGGFKNFGRQSISLR